jgi:apolipoprotein N-acyltransferase
MTGRESVGGTVGGQTRSGVGKRTGDVPRVSRDSGAVTVEALDATEAITADSAPIGARAQARAGSRWRAVGLAFVGGLGLSAAFAPLAWWPVAVPATAAILVAARGQSWRGGLLIGFAAGLGEFLPLVAWLHVVTPAAWIAVSLVESLYLALLGSGLAMVVGRLAGWPIWAACLWVTEELVRDRWPFGGFAWGRLAFSQPDTPFTGFAALGGAPLVTFAVALSAAFLAAAVLAATSRDSGAHRRSLITVLIAAVATIGVPLLGLAVPRPTAGATVQVAVVQGNVPRPGTHFLGRAEEVLDNHLAETAVLVAKVKSGELAAPQLVLWPENASDVDPFEDATAYAKIQAAVAAIGVPILVGAVLQAGPDHASNTGIVWDPVSGPGQRYTKRHLVPFGEFIPWRGLISHLTSLTTLVPENYVSGRAVGVLGVGPATIADVMCFEVAFDEEVRDGVTHGGQLIVVQTNNATYMHTAETRQQLAMSQLRAIEHGRSVVVAATSGISAVIAPNGRVLERTGELTPAIIDTPVVLRTERTVADHLGAAPEWVFGILGVLSIAGAFALNRGGRNRRKGFTA